MKKNIFLLALGLILAQPAIAETTIEWTQAGCESVKGIWITAKSATDSGCDANHCNGMNFCRSGPGMNWFSALIWCKSIGRELATVEDACPNSFASGGSCPNLPAGAGHWTATRDTTGKPYVVKHDRSGFFAEDPAIKTSQPATLCK